MMHNFVTMSGIWIQEYVTLFPLRKSHQDRGGAGGGIHNVATEELYCSQTCILSVLEVITQITKTTKGKLREILHLIDRHSYPRHYLKTPLF